MKSKHVRHALFTLALIGLSACGPLPMEGADGVDAAAAPGKADSVAPPRLEKSFVFAGHAYVLQGLHLAVVQLANPSVTVSRYQTGCMPRRLDGGGGLLYVATDCGVPILDISNPASLRQVGILSTEAGFAARYLRLSGTRLYVTLAKIAAWKLEIHEVSNPAAPQLLGELALSGGSASTEIVAPVGSTHLAVSEYTVGIRILQVANPAQPTLVTTLPVRGVVGMVMKGTLLYVSRGGSFTGYAAHLEIWDLANPASPARLSDTGLPRFVYDQDNLSLSVIGGRTWAFVGGTNGQLEEDFIALDVTDPRNPGAPVLKTLFLPGRLQESVTPADIDVIGTTAWISGWRVPVNFPPGYEYYVVELDLSPLPATPVLRGFYPVFSGVITQ